MEDSNIKKKSWWENRTKIEKCLIVFTVFSVGVIIYLASNLLMTFRAKSSPSEVCMTPNCIQNAAAILKNIDKTVNPCDDFYKFACGNFVKNAIIPGDRVAIGSGSSTFDSINLQLLEICDDQIREKDSKIVKMVKRLYKYCMDTERIEKEGASIIKKEIKELGGMPVLDSYWNEKNFEWTRLEYAFHKLGDYPQHFVHVRISIDVKNSTRRILSVAQPYIPYERYKKGFNDSDVQAMYTLMVENAVLLGAERETAKSDFKDVIEFLIEWTKIITPYEERTNASLEYNLVTIRELQQNFSFMPWLQYINNFLAPIDLVNSNDIINVDLPVYYKKLTKFLPSVRKRILANYMFISYIISHNFYLPEEFRRKQLDYQKSVYGLNEMTPRWKSCVRYTTRLNIAISSLHLKRFVDKKIKSQVSEMVVDIKMSFVDTLKKIPWMDKKTKKHALQKIDRMNSFVAFPDELLNDTKVEEYYKDLEINDGGSIKDIYLNMTNFWHNDYIRKLRKPVVKHDWKHQSFTYIVNAFYSFAENSLQLPAGILRDLFFDADRPKYLNYGAIGEVIGHEITHGFDDSGRQFDKDGDLMDWWEPETNKTYAKKAQCFVEQYGNYTVPEIELSLNGKKTLGENIADNGGIKIAYKGYLKWLERNKKEASLPGLVYTPKQMFWLSTATAWCTKYKKKSLKQQVLMGVHSPVYFRIIVPFMNSDHFGRDWNCPLGSPMNPKYKCRVW